jgi:hypothetical protein
MDRFGRMVLSTALCRDFQLRTEVATGDLIGQLSRTREERDTACEGL